MARRIKSVTMPADAGRDAGKVFILREMSAEQGEEWAARAFLALASAGVAIPDEAAAAGLAGVASVGMAAFSGISWADAKPLMTEMFQCVTIQPDANQPAVTRALIADDIEEIMTRLKLRMELFELHTGFSMGAKKSISGSAARQNPV